MGQRVTNSAPSKDSPFKGSLEGVQGAEGAFEELKEWEPLQAYILYGSTTFRHSSVL